MWKFEGGKRRPPTLAEAESDRREKERRENKREQADWGGARPRTYTRRD